MPLVRSYGIPEVAPAATPNAVPSVPAAGDINFFGGNQARDESTAGQNLQQAGNTAFGIYERMAKEANDTKVDADMNDFITQKQNTLAGFVQTKGKEAIDGASAVTDTLLKNKQSVLESATNAYQKRELSKRLDAHLLDATSSITQHVAREAKSYQVNTTAAKIDLQIRDAVSKRDDTTAVDIALKNAEEGANQLAQQSAGVGPDDPIAKKAVQDTQSKLVADILDAKIAENSESVIPFYDKYKGKLTPEADKRIGAAVTALKDKNDALNFARSGAGGGGTGGAVDNNIGNITKSGAAYAGGKGAPQGPFETFQTPEHGVAAAYQLIDTKARANGGSISFLDLIGGNGKVGGWAPKDDGKDPMLKGNNPLPYATRLAQSVGLKPGDLVPVNDDGKMATILKAMNLHEKGKQTVGDEAYAKGVALAKGGPSAAPAPSDPRAADVRDPLAWGVNRPGQTYDPLQSGVAEATAPQPTVDQAQGVINVRENLIAFENDRQKSLAAAYADLQAKKINPTQYAERVAAVNAFHAQRTQAAELQKNVLWDQINKHIDTYGTMPPTTLTSQLDPKDRMALSDWVDKKLQNKQPPTNWELYSRVHNGLTDVANPKMQQDLANMNPMQLRPHLADEQYKRVLELQAAVNKGDPDGVIAQQGIINRKSDEKLGLLGIKTGPTASADHRASEARFKQLATEGVLQLQKLNPGHKATPDEIDRVINDLSMKTDSGSWYSRDKYVFEQPGANADPSRIRTSINDITGPDRQELTSKLIAAKFEATDQNIIDLYRYQRWGLVPASGKLSPILKQRKAAEEAAKAAGAAPAPAGASIP